MHVESQSVISEIAQDERRINMIVDTIRHVYDQKRYIIVLSGVCGMGQCRLRIRLCVCGVSVLSASADKAVWCVCGGVKVDGVVCGVCTPRQCVRCGQRLCGVSVVCQCRLRIRL